MAQTFTFELDSFTANTTRSLVSDSDWVSFTLAVNPQGGHGTPQTQVKSIGDLTGGSHTVGLVFPNITVNPTDTVVLNYLILNCGLEVNVDANRTLIQSTMQTVGTALAPLVTVPTPPGTVRIPQLASALSVLAAWLTGEFYKLIQYDQTDHPLGDHRCDGTVAAEQSTFTYQDLVSRTAPSRFSQTTVHPGTTSATGCGSNSKYTVNWHIDSSTAVKIVPNVIDMPYKLAEAAITKAGLTWQLARGSVNGVVTNQSPGAGPVQLTGNNIVLITLDNNR